MKKAIKISLICVCVLIFASLFVIASGLIDNATAMPKAPLSVEYKMPQSIDETIALAVTLPDSHKAERVEIYFGDELGKYKSVLGSFEAEENVVVCPIDTAVEVPNGTTKLWVYTSNENGMSEEGYVIDMPYAALMARDVENTSTENDENSGASLEKYAPIVIFFAIVISTFGYAMLKKHS